MPHSGKLQLASIRATVQLQTVCTERSTGSDLGNCHRRIHSGSGKSSSADFGTFLSNRNGSGTSDNARHGICVETTCDRKVILRVVATAIIGFGALSPSVVAATLRLVFRTKRSVKLGTKCQSS